MKIKIRLIGAGGELDMVILPLPANGEITLREAIVADATMAGWILLPGDTITIESESE